VLPPLPPTEPDVQNYRLPVPHGRASLTAMYQLTPSVTHWSTASSAIRCRFVYGVMRPKVLSRVPSTALSSRRPPFLDRVLVSAVPRRRQYYEGATTSHARLPGHLFVSLPGPTRFLLASCSLLPALPSGWRLRFGPGSLFSRRSIAGSLSRGREWDLSGFQATPPVPLPRSKTPAGPTLPRH
jgi:hypothetical protein